jgi:hypothetical protein
VRRSPGKIRCDCWASRIEVACCLPAVVQLNRRFSACLTRHESLKHIHWLAACRERVGVSDVRRVTEFTRLRGTMDDELIKQEQYPMIGQSVEQVTTPTP